MNEDAANRKIKRAIQQIAIMINLWIPVEKRTQYLNYLYSFIIDEEKNEQ
jgi:hypothetical protein